jgi:hypothetical protein
MLNLPHYIRKCHQKHLCDTYHRPLYHSILGVCFFSGDDSPSTTLKDLFSMKLCIQRSILPQILLSAKVLTMCLHQHVSYAFARSSDTRTKCCFLQNASWILDSRIMWTFVVDLFLLKPCCCSGITTLLSRVWCGLDCCWPFSQTVYRHN